MKTKTCKRCKIEKPLDGFLNKTIKSMFNRKDNKRDVCKKCTIGIDYKYSTEEEKLNWMKRSFEKRVVNNGKYCWGWNGSIQKNGYGAMPVYRKKITAHRVSWMIHKGKIPNGKFVCHKCDNKSCTNPDHLFIGTNKDNQLDLIRKRKNKPLKGSEIVGSKLTEKKVRTIYELFYEDVTLKEIARIFNVSRATISSIKSGKTWKHVKI